MLDHGCISILDYPTNGFNYVLIMIKTKNSPVPPCNKKYKLYYKDGGATMLIAKNLTYGTALAISKIVKRYVEDCGSKLEGTFLSPKL